MKRIFISEPLELAAAVLLVGAAITAGAIFHRVALSLLLALLISAGLLIYFAHVYEDVWVVVQKPRLPRRTKRSVVPEAAPGQVVHVCGVCNMGTEADHTECNRVVARTAATMRRPRDP